MVVNDHNDNLEEVRRDIEVTRYALGEKIEKLEEKIETTKKTTLNPTYHLRTHPWPILATVTVLGCWVGRALRSKPPHKAPKTTGGAGIIGTSLASGFASALSSGAAVIAGDFLRSLLQQRRNPHGEFERSLKR
jgi:hypothetical protein